MPPRARSRPARPPRRPRPIDAQLDQHEPECEQLRADLREKFGKDDAELNHLISQAVDAYRRQLQARDLVQQLGLIMGGPHGPVRNPAVTIEASARRDYGFFIQRLREGVRRQKTGGPTLTDRLPSTPTPSRVSRRYLQAPPTVAS